MQYLKEELKENILKVALDEFYEKGFEKTNMRSIAQKVRISPGNIYRYYHSKNDLIKAIYQPIEKEIDEIVYIEDPGNRHGFDTMLVVDKIILLIEKYPKEFYLLSNTHLADYVKHSLIEEVVERLLEKDNDTEYAYIKASLIIEGIFLILKRQIGNIEKAKKYIKSLIIMLFERKDPNEVN